MTKKNFVNQSMKSTMLIGVSFLGFAALNQQEQVNIPAPAFLSASADNTPARADNTPQVATDQLKAGKWGTAGYSFNEETGELTLSNGDLQSVDNKDDALKSLQPSVKSIKIGDNVTVSQASNLFAGFTAVESYTDLNKLKFTENKQFDNMFINNTALKSIDLSFMADNVKESKFLSGMFAHDTSLTSINLNGWQPKARDYQDMFYDCHSLESLDLSGFDMTTEKVDVHNMLYNAMALKHLVLGPNTKVDGTNLPAFEWKNKDDGKDEDSGDLSDGTWDYEGPAVTPTKPGQPGDNDSTTNGQANKDDADKAADAKQGQEQPAQAKQPQTAKEAPKQNFSALLGLTALSAAAFAFFTKKTK